MNIVVLGPVGSGKSLYAEKLTASISDGPLVYIATMVPHGEEGLKRVEKHKLQRKGYGFVTIESPDSLLSHELPVRATVLLEDVSNLLGNAIFESKSDAGGVLNDIFTLGERCENLVIVSISGLKDTDGGDVETKAYINDLNIINSRLVEWADKAFLMEDGAPNEIYRI